MNWCVIIADESVIIHRTIEHILAGKGYDLHFYQDGSKALHAVRDIQPELVFAGTDLKGVDGYSFCSLVKKESGLKRVKVFLLVPDEGGLDEEKVEQCGADGYLTKPFEEEALLHTIRSVITAEDKIAALEKRLEHAEGRLNINRKELAKKILYEAIPEIEKFVIQELRESVQKTVEEKIPYAIERIVTEKLEKGTE